MQGEAPAYIAFDNPYGGLGLKTKSAAGARRRIDGLLATSDEVAMQSCELHVIEPCSSELLGQAMGPFEAQTAFRSEGRTRTDLPAVAAAAGHAHGALAAEAWQRFGPPNAVSGHQRDGAFNVGWRWVDDSATATCQERMDAWFPFLAAHDDLMLDDHATRVGIHATWTLRLRSADGAVVAAPFPATRISAHLSGRHASAFFDLVFPYDGVTPAFVADHAATCAALGMTLPPGSFRLSTPKKKGSGRVRRRLPKW